MTLNLVSSFSERLKIALTNMSETELANKIGMSKQAISTYITGIRNPKRPVINAIAEQLNLNPMWLLGYDVPKHSDLPQEAIPIKHFSQVPVYGEIAAGLPALADNVIERYEFADVKDPENHFYLRVKGDSMINARIMTGDLVLLKKQNTAENGNIVACLVDGESATLKRFKQIDDRILLMPENPKYEPLILSCSDFESGYACILGVVKEIKIKL